ncbi:MAG: hypothetical protein EKK41_09015 [Hyphomicrobiales bacterium]|nr:MAG: hypothetical protein EKK41_09015 [Hyphomicrobiales bacterium]
MSARQELFSPSKGAAPALHSEPSPAERAQIEHAVRTAATAAAQMEGGSLPRAVLDYIVATSDFRQNRQALEARAASIANHVVHDVKAPNWSGAHPTEVAAYLASLGKHFGDYRRHAGLQGAGEANGVDGDRVRAAGTNKGASYSDLPWSEEKLGAYAREKGVPWLANHPDLRRLTPAAIETFAKMKFDKESYHALTRDAGLSPEKAHGLVKAMEAAKVTPDEAKELAKRMGATSKGLSPEEQQRRHELMLDWLKALKDDPAKAAAKLEEMRKEREELVKRRPDKAKAVSDEEKAQQEIQRRIELERKAEAIRKHEERNTHVSEKKAELVEKKAEVIAGHVEANNAKLAALLGPAPGLTSPPDASKPTPASPTTPPAAANPAAPPAQPAVPAASPLPPPGPK